MTRALRFTFHPGLRIVPCAPRPTEASLKIVLSEPLNQFLTAFSSRRAGYLAFTLTVTVATIVLVLFLKPWFRSQGTLLPPPESNDSYGSLAGLIQSSALGSLGLVTTSTTSDVFAEILKSRTLHEAAIEKFHFDTIYKLQGMDRTLGEFRRHLSVEVGRSAVITLSFEDNDPRRASEVVNFLISELDRFNREAYNTRAKRTRLFLENRLNDTQARLGDAQSRLSAYEKEHKVLAGSDKASVEGVANVMAQKLSLQVRRAYLSQYSDPSNPALQAVNAQIEAMDREIGRLPGLREEGARLALEVEVQSKLFSLVSAQYEEARIQEARDTPTVTVLDPARVPELKVRPKRTLIVAAAALAAVALCVLYTLVEIRSAATA